MKKIFITTLDQMSIEINNAEINISTKNNFQNPKNQDNMFWHRNNKMDGSHDMKFYTRGDEKCSIARHLQKPSKKCVKKCL